MNADGYFAVTGHWIEETQPGIWKLQNALLGFVRLNNAHNGIQLGQALFKVICRVGIEHKVSSRPINCALSCELSLWITQIGYVTCDNASNNGTMMQQFAERILEKTGKVYDPIERCVW